MKVTWGICLSVFFINHAYLCRGIRQNFNEMCLFSPLGYYHMTYIGKQNSWRGLLTPWTMTHDHFLKKKGSTNKVVKQEIKEKRGGFKPLHLGILCITGYPVHVAQKCTLAWWIDHFVIACSPCTAYGYQYTQLGGWGDCPQVQPLPLVLKE